MGCKYGVEHNYCIHFALFLQVGRLRGRVWYTHLPLILSPLRFRSFEKQL